MASRNRSASTVSSASPALMHVHECVAVDLFAREQAPDDVDRLAQLRVARGLVGPRLSGDALVDVLAAAEGGPGALRARCTSARAGSHARCRHSACRCHRPRAHQLDGSAKGGFVLAVQQKTGIPPCEARGSGRGHRRSHGLHAARFRAAAHRGTATGPRRPAYLPMPAVRPRTIIRCASIANTRTGSTATSEAAANWSH